MGGLAIPEEMLAAIVAAPDDPGPRAVVADWLQERGDPFGELIALSIAGGDAERIASLEKAEEQHSPWRVGRRWGFVEHLGGDFPGRWPTPAELAWLASPRMRLVRTMSIDLNQCDPTPVLAVIQPELRALSLWSWAGYLGPIKIPWSRMPHLVRFEACLPGFLGPLMAPALEELVLAGCLLSVFDGAELPSLRVLHLHVQKAPTRAELATLLARLPALRHLAIHAHEMKPIEPPDAPLEVFEVVETGHTGPGRRRLLVDRTPTTPYAVMLCRRGALGSVLRLDPRTVNEIATTPHPTYGRVTMVWNENGWWLQKTRPLTLNRTLTTEVPLRDGDELASPRFTYRLIAAPTEPELDAKIRAMSSRYGLVTRKWAGGALRRDAPTD